MRSVTSLELLPLVTLALGLVLAPARAEAHAVGVSRGTWTPSATGLRATLTFARHDADALATAAPGGAHLVLALREGIRVSRQGIPCVAGADGDQGSVHDVAPDGVSINLTWQCHGDDANLQVDLPLFDALPAGHRHLAEVGGDDDGADTNLLVLHSAARTMKLPVAVAGPTTTSTAPGLMRLGVTHVLGGWDHVLFLFGLVLTGGSLRSLVGIVSAFTVGHSASLASAMLLHWAPSPRIIEPLIALSIAWVGIEALRRLDGRGRWRIMLLFGLVHGFGFAGALTEIGLPVRQVPMALLAFNTGVEIAQLLALLILVPAVTWLWASHERSRRVMPALAGSIVVAGVSAFLWRVAAG